MLSNQKCCQCLNHFTMVKLPRKLPSCPHTICQTCLRQIMDTKQDVLICAFCSTSLPRKDLRIFPLNTSLLISLSSPTKYVQPPLIEQQNQLLSDPIQTNLQKVRENPIEQQCSLHKTIMDIICISDKQKICAHCALFGKHKDHRFKRVDDFHKEISQKRKSFDQILSDKKSLMRSENYKIYQQLRKSIQLKRVELLKDIDQQHKEYTSILLKAKQSAYDEVKDICSNIQQYFNSLTVVNKFQKSRVKFQKWQKTCVEALQEIDHSYRVEQKLSIYYEGPLQIVTEGYVFIEELNKYGQEAMKKLNQRIGQIILEKNGKDKWSQKLFSFTNGENHLNSLNKEEVSQVNPFLDCTSSQITYAQASILNSTTLQAQLSTISKQMRGDFSPSRKQTLKNIKSAQKPKISTGSQKFSLSKSPTLKRPSSQTIYKLTPRLVKNITSKQIIPENQTQSINFEIKQPEKIYQQFVKNTLTDFFDISECYLPSEKVIEFVHKAKRVHRLKGLKLCNNRLTAVGFQKMIEYLNGVSNINVANNNINQEIFDVIFFNKDRLLNLKMINLSHNPITLDKKAMTRMQEIKKSGIIIVL